MKCAVMNRRSWVRIQVIQYFHNLQIYCGNFWFQYYFVGQGNYAVDINEYYSVYIYYTESVVAYLVAFAD